MFDPTIGRWMSEDPDGFEAADPNLFRYCENNPTNLVDPSGLCPPGRWQSAGVCPQPSYSYPLPCTNPNAREERHDYELTSSSGTVVHMSFLNYTPADSDKLAEIVRAIRNNLAHALDDLNHFTAEQYESPSGWPAQMAHQVILRSHLDRWFLNEEDPRDSLLGNSEIVGVVRGVLQKVADGLDKCVTVFEDSSVQKDKQPELYAHSRFHGDEPGWTPFYGGVGPGGEMASQVIPGRESRYPLKVGEPYSSKYAIITYPFFWQDLTDDRLKYYTIFHELTHYYANTVDNFYVENGFWKENKWTDDNNPVIYSEAGMGLDKLNSDNLVNNADSIAGFFTQYYYSKP